MKTDLWKKQIFSKIMCLGLLGLGFSVTTHATGISIGPVGVFARNTVPEPYWDNWQSSWGGGLALQADLAYLTFEIDALYMQRQIRFVNDTLFLTGEATYTARQIEIPILLYLRTGGMFSLRFGGGISNNFGQGKIGYDSAVYAGGTKIAESSSEISYAQAGIDDRGMDGILAVGSDLSLGLAKLKFDFRYQMALEDRNTVPGGTEIKPRSFNFMMGFLF